MSTSWFAHLRKTKAKATSTESTPGGCEPSSRLLRRVGVARSRLLQGRLSGGRGEVEARACSKFGIHVNTPTSAMACTRVSLASATERLTGSNVAFNRAPHLYVVEISIT